MGKRLQPDWVRVMEFANAAGITRSAVTACIRRKSLSAKKMDGIWHVDMNELENHLSKTTSPRAISMLNGKGMEFDTDRLKTAMLNEKIYKAKTAQLEYEKKKGMLVELDQVIRVYSDLIERAKQAILAVPDRTCPMMEGMSHREMHNTLTKELKYALSNLDDRVRPEGKRR